MTLALAELGWSVAIHYHRSAEAAGRTADDARAYCAHVEAISANLAVEQEAASLLPRAAEMLGGPISLLINNASCFERDEVDSVSRASWDRHMETNLRAPFLLSQSFAAQELPDARLSDEPVSSGLIVNMLDQRVLNLTPHFTSYTLSKSALWTLTQTLAMALGPHIRVNAIGPGPALPATGQSIEHFQAQRRGTPLQRGGDPEDVAAALRYLIAAPSVTGQIITLDGGQHLNWRA
ncbi:MAG: SDR family oxidoreductase [Neomegalonema sp.]|nr:SDR family oxidoreductase [Neomegalonema sp.]